MDAQKKEIERLLATLQALLQLVAISEKELGWANDTIDLVEICYLMKEPDGDRQHEVKATAEQEGYLTYGSAKKELLTRIDSLLEYNEGIKNELY